MKEFDIGKHDNVNDLFYDFVDQDDSLWYLLPLLEYAEECDSVVEYGTWQGQSLSAFIKAEVPHIVSVDINLSRVDSDMFESIAHDMTLSLEILPGNSLNESITKRVQPDMLFLDTVHTYEHVLSELKVHGPHVQKYIGIHDTNYPPPHKNPAKRVEDAVKEFVAETEWEIDSHIIERTGLMVLKK